MSLIDDFFFFADKCLLVSDFWTQSLSQHLVSVAYLFSTTAGLTLASFVLGLAVLRELTLSVSTTRSEFEEGGGRLLVFQFSAFHSRISSSFFDTC